MSFIQFLKKMFFNKEKENKKYEKEPKREEDIINNEEFEKQTEILSIWDFLKCNEYTQAYHLVTVIPYDEWIDMIEIRQRILTLFQIEYKNDRSLYPYLKTMVDLGLIETNNIGGKRKWRKKDLLIKIEKEKEEEIKIEQKIKN